MPGLKFFGVLTVTKGLKSVSVTDRSSGCAHTADLVSSFVLKFIINLPLTVSKCMATTVQRFDLWQAASWLSLAAFPLNHQGF